MKRFALMLAVFAMAMGASVAAQAKTLRVTIQVPQKHILGQNILLFKKLVEEKTGGEIEVELYDSAQLFKGSEVPQAVSSGSIDMGIVLLTEYSGTIPATGLFSVPFLFPTYDDIREATAPDAEVRKALDEAILKTGARVLWWQAYGPVHMLSKDEPIRTPAEVKNKKVRVIGKSIGDYIREIGGAPVVIAGSEQFLAYQRGTVDIGMTGTTATKSRRLYEVMDYITLTNHANIEFLVLINDKVFQDLTDEQRKAVADAAVEAEKTLRDNTETLNQQAADYLRKETNMEVVELKPDEVKQWQDAAKPVIERFAQQGPLAQKLVESVQ